MGLKNTFRKVGSMIVLNALSKGNGEMFAAAAEKMGISADDLYDVNAAEQRTDIAAFQAKHPGYYVVFEHEVGMASTAVMNYDTTAKKLPAYQEVVEFGNVSDDGGKIVYSVDIMKGTQYFSAEYDRDTKEKIKESGDWFLDEPEEEKTSALLALIDEIIKD